MSEDRETDVGEEPTLVLRNDPYVLLMDPTAGLLWPDQNVLSQPTPGTEKGLDVQSSSGSASLSHQLLQRAKSMPVQRGGVSKMAPSMCDFDKVSKY
jgi:hypothetical protein